MSSTRSPVCSESTWLASVNGIDAGPMLPRSGNDRGTRSESMPSVRHIAAVCTWETWWAM